jgi:protein-tyrosine phosphatase
MGAVHGVYLKYVGMSALSFVGYNMLNTDGSSTDSSTSAASSAEKAALMMDMLPSIVLGYSALLNGIIAILFKSERAMFILGKDKTTGKIPLWSYLVYFPFHLPTLLYTHVHSWAGKSIYKHHVPVATEVQPGWWVGGCYGHELDKDWGGVVDLTVEFPESCIDRTKSYLSAPTWDGVPLDPAGLEAAASFAVGARKDGDVIVHCAHGRGRSTTVMCACLVKAGLYENWKDAFEKGIKPQRPVCKLNKRMRENLALWQKEYVDSKKDI